MGPDGVSELAACPSGSPQATQENNDTPLVRGEDVTSYKESDLVAEPHKVRWNENVVSQCLWGPVSLASWLRVSWV